MVFTDEYQINPLYIKIIIKLSNRLDLDLLGHCLLKLQWSGSGFQSNFTIYIYNFHKSKTLKALINKYHKYKLN